MNGDEELLNGEFDDRSMFWTALFGESEDGYEVGVFLKISRVFDWS